jgi:Domain of unknown function (DUF4190)
VTDSPERAALPSPTDTPDSPPDVAPDVDEEALRRPRRPPGPPYDGLAIAAFVLSLVGVHLVGVVLGHVALGRIRDSGRRGRGLAIAAVVLGYAGIVLALAAWVVYFSVFAPIVTLPG